VFQEAALSLPRDQRGDLWRVEKILAGLGFGAADRLKHPGELSGGFQVRLNLSKVLLADYNMLLLDEPNNYLDITSIRWLEKFLVAWPGEMMLVTHDRSFMDKVVTHTMAIHRRKVKKIEGDTGKLYGQIAMEEETYEKTRVNDERRRKEIENFIAKFRASAQLQGLVESRKKTLVKMGRKEKLESIRTLDFAFTYKTFHGKYVMNSDGLSFGYDPAKPLIEDFGLSIGSKDRVFIIGPNGKGKTTLLKLLAGRLEPQAGTAVSPMAVTPGYFEQTNVQALSPRNTVLDEIQNADTAIEPSKARFLAGMMMFEDDDALKKIAVLSGGEKSRVLLAKLIASPVNLLLLDEPTNHLDMDSSDALLAALDEFDGAVIMVTHNEMFLHALAERLIVFQDDKITVFEGSYERFLERVGWSVEADRSRLRADETVPTADGPPILGRKELRKVRSEIVAEKSRALRPLEQRMNILEKDIERVETDIVRMNKEIIAASQTRDSGKIVELSKSIHQLRRDLDRYFEDLEPLLQDYEFKRTEFDKRLGDLEPGEKSPSI
jgi:ATP-binding cassette subfamily F protein 3